MKTLILLRHAKSSWKYPELQDIDRPLNKRGRKDAPKMGKWLKAHCSTPDVVLTSPAVRTLATISKVGFELGLNGDDYHTDSRLYHANAPTLWQIIRSSPNTVNSLLIVGHNPGLTEFANQICPSEEVENIPTCGVFGLKLHCSTWEEAGKDVAEFLFFQYPKNLDF